MINFLSLKLTKMKRNLYLKSLKKSLNNFIRECTLSMWEWGPEGFTHFSENFS